MEPTFETLATRVGQDYAFATTGGEVTLTLVQATPHGDHPGGSLLFTGPSSRPLEQGTYDVTHAEVAGALFIVPVSDDATERTYQAVFA